MRVWERRTCGDEWKKDSCGGGRNSVGKKPLSCGDSVKETREMGEEQDILLFYIRASLLASGI